MKIILIAFLICLTPTSQAVEFDFGFGVSKYVNNNNGLWYVEPFPHDMKMVTTAFDLGISETIFEKDNWGLKARAGLVYLGKITTIGKVPSWKTNVRAGGFVGPDFIGAHQKDPCYGECTNMTTFNGKGSDKGITLVLEPYLKRGHWQYSVFGGVYAHKSTWSQHLTGANDSPTGPDYELHVKYNQGIKFGGVAGFSVSRDNIYIRYQYFRIPRTWTEADGSDAFPPAFNAAHLLTIGVKF